MNKNYNLDYKVSPTRKCTKYVKSCDENSFSQHSYSDHIVRANLCNTLISILFNTNNIETSIYSIKKFIDKSSDPKKLQFCIKVDKDKNFTEEFLKKLEDFKSNFIIISSPKGRGYIDLWQWINHLFKISSKKSKFVINISDEMFVNENNWDLLLEKYIGKTEDKIFRLRTSVYKNRNYNNLFECGYAPDTTAIYSRRYLELQGDFSPCFGPDNGQQFVAYYLATLNYPRHYQFLRDYVIETITFSGQGTNKGLKGKSRNQRMVDNYLLWQNMFKLKFQREYFLRARKLQVAILKHSFPDIKIEDNINLQRFDVKHSVDNKNTAVRLSYKISPIKMMFHNLRKINFFKYHTGFDRSRVDGLITHFYIKILKKWPKSKPPVDNPESLLEKTLIYCTNKGVAAKKLINPKIGCLKEMCIVEFLFFIPTLIISLLIFVLTIYNFRINLIVLNRTFNIYRRSFFAQKNSLILSNNKIDQSKTIVLKGD